MWRAQQRARMIGLALLVVGVLALVALTLLAA